VPTFRVWREISRPFQTANFALKFESCRPSQPVRSQAPHTWSSLKTPRHRGISQIWTDLRIRNVALEALIRSPVSKGHILVSRFWWAARWSDWVRGHRRKEASSGAGAALPSVPSGAIHLRHFTTISVPAPRPTCLWKESMTIRGMSWAMCAGQVSPSRVGTNAGARLPRSCVGPHYTRLQGTVKIAADHLSIVVP